jgi:hypothetical protein
MAPSDLAATLPTNLAPGRTILPVARAIARPCGLPATGAPIERVLAARVRP